MSSTKIPLLQDNSYLNMTEEQEGDQVQLGSRETFGEQDLAEEGVGEPSTTGLGSLATAAFRGSKQLLLELSEKGTRSWRTFFKTLGKFLGPGFMVSVGYTDPGNWATDLDAGSRFGYKLLFIILLSNFMAMLLQSLCIKLGVVTGQDLAQSCRKHVPKWGNLILYVLCEIAIMSTDLAEVIGSAIALKLLLHIPLFYGVLITGLDVLIIVMFGFNAKHMRYFERLIGLLVLLTASCLFAVAAKSGPVMTDVLVGYIPSSLIITNPAAVYIAVGIIGATVMPHNLYLHSSIVKYRSNGGDGEIEDFDNHNSDMESAPSADTLHPLSKILAIPTSLQMSYIDSILALTFALFVNSSILIIASANFHQKGLEEVADIEAAFYLIGEYLGSAFATLFAFALLLAGQSSTITGTMAGQIVMEGFLGGAIRLKPWVRRLVTRLLAIGPALVCIIIYGESGLNNLLILSQIILSLQLPFAVWPLVYFTCSKSIMTLKFSGQRYSQTEIGGLGEDGSGAGASNAHLVGGDAIALDDTSRAAAASLSPSLQSVDYSNNRTTAFFAIVVASLLTIFNIVLLVQVAIGQAG